MCLIICSIFNSQNDVIKEHSLNQEKIPQQSPITFNLEQNSILKDKLLSLLHQDHGITIEDTLMSSPAVCNSFENPLSPDKLQKRRKERIQTKA